MSSSGLSGFFSKASALVRRTPFLSSLFGQLTVSAPDPVVPGSEVPVTIVGAKAGESCVVSIGDLVTKTVTATSAGQVVATLALATTVAPGTYTVTAQTPARKGSCSITIVRDVQAHTKQV